MNALVYPDMPPEKIVERKTTIEEATSQLEQLKKEAKKVTNITIVFWSSIIQYEQLKQLTNNFQQVEGQLETLKNSLRTMSPPISIM